MSTKSFLFLHTEFSSQTTLMELFPRSHDGDFPPMRTFKYEPNPQLMKLRRIVNESITEFDTNSTLISRNLIIIGWKDRNLIKPLSNLMGKSDHVFNIDTDKFVSLNPEELKRLGVNRRFSFVRANDEAAAIRKPVPQTYYQENNQAHNYYLRGNRHINSINKL